MQTSTVTSDIAERVEAGAAFLDERHPGWVDDIDTEKLDLIDCRVCVLGQLFGSFSRGLDTLDLGDRSARRFGFDTFLESYHDLTDAWLESIMERQS